MIKFIIDAISQGLAFSKTEARGTFILAVIVILAITSFHFVSSKMKDSPDEEFDPTELAKWVNEIETSYSLKKPVVQKAKLYSPASTKKTFKHSSTKPLMASSEKSEEVFVVLDLNIASAEELQRVRGIGKVYSERIVKYRELLGGFANSNQLLEVYGITKELVASINENFEVQTSTKPINFNADSAKHLAKHPYISYDLAWVIINYRKQNGDIETVEDLLKVKALNDSVLHKLKPYLK
ncbi:MAG: helix-hairpin-helix domain-containing protein [Cyclobacteriaceae bacterium]